MVVGVTGITVINLLLNVLRCYLVRKKYRSIELSSVNGHNLMPASPLSRMIISNHRHLSNLHSTYAHEYKRPDVKT